MALIVLDPCNLGFSPAPEGFVIQVGDIDGFPEGLKLVIPIGDEAAVLMHEKLGEVLAKRGKTVPIADMADFHREVNTRRGGSPR